VGKTVKSVQHQQRLAAALRENLKRRKTRARALAEDGPDGPLETDVPASDPPSGRPNKAADRD